MMLGTVFHRRLEAPSDQLKGRTPGTFPPRQAFRAHILVVSVDSGLSPLVPTLVFTLLQPLAADVFREP